MKQRNLFKVSNYNSEFGGTLNKGKRKARRPFSSKHACHLVLRADMARSGSLLRFRRDIDLLFLIYSQKFNIKIYKMALVSNHIHIVALFTSRDNYIKFIRAVTGILSARFKIKWQLRPWTRFLKWGRDLRGAISYAIQNHLEAIGAIQFQKRIKKYNLTV